MFITFKRKKKKTLEGRRKRAEPRLEETIKKVEVKHKLRNKRPVNGEANF